MFTSKLLSLLVLTATATAQVDRPLYIVVGGSVDGNWARLGCLTAQGRVSKGNCGTFHEFLDGPPKDDSLPHHIYSGTVDNKAMCTMLDTSQPPSLLQDDPAAEGQTYYAMNCNGTFNGQFPLEDMRIDRSTGSPMLTHHVAPLVAPALPSFDWAIPARPTSAADEIPVWVWPWAIHSEPRPGVQAVLLEFTPVKPF